MALKTTNSKKATTPKKKLTAEEIRVRAQQIYHERVSKGKQGDELSDWLSAERELLGKG
jgi:hypothetical protein